MLKGINLKEKYKIFSAPKSEVEHRTSHASDHAVLNVFETSTITHHFDLKFDAPVIVAMIQGEKTMHLNKKSPFQFLPGQSIVMPSDELMYIDFPNATRNNPTQCMALEISDGFVKKTLEWLNEFFPKQDDLNWNWTEENFLLLNNKQVDFNLNRLVQVMVNNDFGRQMIASNTTQELIASLLQTQARYYLLQNLDKLSTRNRLAHVVKFIRNSLNDSINIEKLAETACLSRAQFFRAFQRELGETPIQFIIRERLELAKRKILMQNMNITQACFESGFSSVNYFSRIFKQAEGISPTLWKIKQVNRLKQSSEML